MAKTQCAREGDNHSDDIVTIWSGRPEPLVLCGFHAMKEGHR